MPPNAALEAVAKLRVGRNGLAGESANARKILHAIEGMAASWHKIRNEHYAMREAPEFQQGRAQMAVQGIALLLGTSQGKVREALENQWL